MVFMTYVIYQSFGPRRKTLLYTKEEKDQWDNAMKRPFGTWCTVTNIVGALTSLATSYIFFIGSAPYFGIAIVACSITLLFSIRITNSFSRAILEQPYYKALLQSPDQTAGVISSAFWRPDDLGARHTARAARWVSLINIASVIWLDFAFFGDTAGSLLHHEDLLSRTILVAFCCVTVTYFTLRFGLRGVVFADAFQSPMILFAGVILLIGSLMLFASTLPPVTELLLPSLPWTEVGLFVFQLIFLNLFVNLVTEAHWLRLWIFKEKEIIKQASGIRWTALLWVILAAVGLLAGNVSGGKQGVAAVLGFLGKLAAHSPVFVTAFWIGAMAALFASADTYIYSFLVVSRFRIKTGRVANLEMSRLRPLLLSLGVTIVFAGLYAAVRHKGLGLDQLVFLVFPLSLNIFPAFIRIRCEKSQSAKYIVASLLLYLVFVGIAVYRPASEFYWRLFPSLCPMVVSLFAWLKK